MTLRETIEQSVKSWHTVGHPAFIESFVLKYGVEFAGSPLPRGLRARQIKQCYKNATEYVLSKNDAEYYEGIAMENDIGFPFQHAWAVRGGKVIELTLRKPQNYSYIGIHFSRDTLFEEIARNGVYGLLDTGMTNVRLLRSIDNDLVEELLKVRPSKEFVQLSAQVAASKA